MIDDALIEGIQTIANDRISKNYPVMGEHYYKTSDIRIILESLASLLEVWKHHKREERKKK